MMISVTVPSVQVMDKHWGYTWTYSRTLSLLWWSHNSPLMRLCLMIVLF